MAEEPGREDVRKRTPYLPSFVGYLLSGLARGPENLFICSRGEGGSSSSLSSSSSPSSDAACDASTWVLLETKHLNHVLETCLARGVARTVEDFISWQDEYFLRKARWQFENVAAPGSILVRLPRDATDPYLLSLLRRESSPLGYIPVNTWNGILSHASKCQEGLRAEFSTENAQAVELVARYRHDMWPTQLETLENMTIQLLIGRSLKKRHHHGGWLQLNAYTSSRARHMLTTSDLGFLLCGDVGTGKTRVAATYCAMAATTATAAVAERIDDETEEEKKEDMPPQNILVVAPLSCHSMWKDAFAKFAAMGVVPVLNVTMVTPHKLGRNVKESGGLIANSERMIGPVALIYANGTCYVTTFLQIQQAHARLRAWIVVTEQMIEQAAAAQADQQAAGLTFAFSAGQEVEIAHIEHTRDSNSPWPKRCYRARVWEACSKTSSLDELRQESVLRRPASRLLVAIVDEAHLLSKKQAAAVACLDCETVLGITASPLGSTAHVFGAGMHSGSNTMIAAQRHAFTRLMQTFNITCVTPLSTHLAAPPPPPSIDTGATDTSTNTGTGAESGASSAPGGAAAIRFKRETISISDARFDDNIVPVIPRIDYFTAVSLNRLYAIETLSWTDPQEAMTYAGSLRPTQFRWGDTKGVAPTTRPAKRTVVNRESVFGLESCPICLSTPQAHPMALLPCRHTLCEACASELQTYHISKNRCPLCRTGVESVARVRVSDEEPLPPPPPPLPAAEGGDHPGEEAEAAGAGAGAGVGVEEVLLDERLEWLVDHLTANPTQKMVIFSNFNINVGKIVKSLRGRRISCVSMCGNTTANARARAIASFTDDPGMLVFVATYKTSSTGLNLQSASKVLFFELPMDAAVLHQAIGRVSRPGQASNVITLYNFHRQSAVASIERELDRRMLHVSIDGSDVVWRSDHMRSRIMAALREKCETISSR